MTYDIRLNIMEGANKYANLDNYYHEGEQFDLNRKVYCLIYPKISERADVRHEVSFNTLRYCGLPSTYQVESSFGTDKMVAIALEYKNEVPIRQCEQYAIYTSKTPIPYILKDEVNPEEWIKSMAAIIKDPASFGNLQNQHNARKGITNVIYNPLIVNAEMLKSSAVVKFTF